MKYIIKKLKIIINKHYLQRDKQERKQNMNLNKFSLNKKKINMQKDWQERGQK